MQMHIVLIAGGTKHLEDNKRCKLEPYTVGRSFEAKWYLELNDACPPHLRQTKIQF